MRHTAAAITLLLLAAHPASAEDDHSHGAAQADRHVMGTVTSVAKDGLELDTAEGTKTVMLSGQSNSDASAPETQLKKGDQVTVHADMKHDGTLQAHSIYRGRCGGMAEECQSKDLAWSHMHAMKSGRQMGHGMMKKHMHDKQ